MIVQVYLVEVFRAHSGRFLGRFERASLFLPLDPPTHRPWTLDPLPWEHWHVWHALSIAQHYGVPTRLLDWTGSPFVAAFFACCSEPDADGAIWWFNQSELEAVITREMMWDVWNVPVREGDPRLERAIEQRAFRTDATRWIAALNFPLPFRRMETQHGFFTTCGRLDMRHDEAIDALNIHVGRVIIPKQWKDAVLNRLEKMGISAPAIDYPGADFAGWKCGAQQQ